MKMSFAGVSFVSIVFCFYSLRLLDSSSAANIYSIAMRHELLLGTRHINLGSLARFWRYCGAIAIPPHCRGMGLKPGKCCRWGPQTPQRPHGRRPRIDCLWRRLVGNLGALVLFLRPNLRFAGPRPISGRCGYTRDVRQLREVRSRQGSQVRCPRGRCQHRLLPGCLGHRWLSLHHRPRPRRRFALGQPLRRRALGTPASSFSPRSAAALMQGVARLLLRGLGTSPVAFSG
jgi:hypothetical protein